MARQVAEAMGCDFMYKDIKGIISKGGLTDDELVIPPVSYDELPEGVSPTYVPFRNGTLLSIITGIASIDEEAVAVYYGAHAEDAANSAYPDCSPEFIVAMRTAIRVGTYGKIILQAPLMYLKKHQVVSLGEVHHVPWELTWSCYEGNELHCGICPTCRARREAFALAEVPDPTRYDNHPSMEAVI